MYPSTDEENQSKKNRLDLLTTCLQDVQPLDLSNLNKSSLKFIFENKAVTFETSFRDIAIDYL